jgi:hypothetical protein
VAQAPSGIPEPFDIRLADVPIGAVGPSATVSFGARVLARASTGIPESLGVCSPERSRGKTVVASTSSSATEENGMPVLMIAEVPELTEEIYGGMIGQLMPLMRASQGFIAHAGGPNPTGGWRVVEIWESEEDGENWFNDSVKPNLPPGIDPNRTYHPLHSAFTK